MKNLQNKVENRIILIQTTFYFSTSSAPAFLQLLESLELSLVRRSRNAALRLLEARHKSFSQIDGRSEQAKS